MGIGLKLTGFYRNVEFSTALVVRQNWEQLPTAAYWIRGISPAQIITPAAMMSRALCVGCPITANLKVKFLTLINKTFHRGQSDGILRVSTGLLQSISGVEP